MTIVLVGGGTGGHILPLLAVAHSLKSNSNLKLNIVAITDKDTKFAKPLIDSVNIHEVYKINAGKYRRYPNQTLLKTMLDVKTMFLNIRDGFRVLFGILESYHLLKKLKPDVIFIKGGFVGVPIGVAARLLKIKFITHDSDASPGLANKIIGKWASWHTVGMRPELYDYDLKSTTQVGIPINENFNELTPNKQKAFKEQLDIPDKAKLVLITGGSQGSQIINQIIDKDIDKIVSDNIAVIHQTGQTKEQDSLSDLPNYHRINYINDLYVYSGAADVIITRAGSTIAEFAAQKKAIIVIPAPHLSDGHQLKNAKLLEIAQAAVILDETELIKHPELLVEEIKKLLADTNKCQILGENLNKLYPNNAANEIAKILFNVIGVEVK